MQMLFILAVAAACVVIYWLLIRPKLHAIAELDPYLDAADERYARWWTAIRGWRVEAFSFVGIFALELPNLIDIITGANLVAYVPDKYQHGLQLALLVLALVRAFITKRTAERRLEDGE